MDKLDKKHAHHAPKPAHRHDDSFSDKLKEVAKGNVLEHCVEKGLDFAKNIAPAGVSPSLDIASAGAGMMFTGLAVVDAVELVARVGKMFVGKPLSFDQQNELLAVKSSRDTVSIHSTRNLHFKDHPQHINPAKSIQINYNANGRGAVSQARTQEFSREISLTR